MAVPTISYSVCRVSRKLPIFTSYISPVHQLALSPASGSTWQPDCQRLTTGSRLQLSLPILSFILIPSASAVPYKIWKSHMLEGGDLFYSFQC